MESINIDNDVEMNDEEIMDNFPSALPDLPEGLVPLEDDADAPAALSQDADNAAVLEKLKGMKGAGKRVIRNPQPKLDGTRLTGDRGIPILPRLFKDVKFKGKGHEAEDLRVVMKFLEHWALRLFPKMPFDEVLERVEKLGCKKEVQTCVKRMRMDMPILTSDFVHEEDEDEEGEGDATTRGNEVDVDTEAAFDEIMREEEERRQSQQPSLTSLFNSPSSSKSQPVTTHRIDSVARGLTPDQKERMERNKRLAMEKKAARIALKTSDSTNATPTVPDQIKVVARPDSPAIKETTPYDNAEIISNSTTACDDTVLLSNVATANDNAVNRSNGITACDNTDHPSSGTTTGDDASLPSNGPTTCDNASLPSNATCDKASIVPGDGTEDLLCDSLHQEKVILPSTDSNPSLHLYLSDDCTVDTTCKMNTSTVTSSTTMETATVVSTTKTALPESMDTQESLHLHLSEDSGSESMLMEASDSTNNLVSLSPTEKSLHLHISGESATCVTATVEVCAVENGTIVSVDDVDDENPMDNVTKSAAIVDILTDHETLNLQLSMDSESDNTVAGND